MADRTIVCLVCSTNFDFLEEEQAFYQERGFQDPKKCKPCRQNSKSVRQNFNQKRSFDTVCSACGLQTQVPFIPKGDKPVYCRECYQSAKTTPLPV